MRSQVQTETVHEFVPAGSSIAPVQRVTLPNGVTVISKEVHQTPIVSIQLWMRTGSVNETKANSGISHFSEHMYFKGTEKYGVGEMDRLITSWGGRNNAGTWIDFTFYYVDIPSDHALKGLDILADALLHSTFDPAEIEKERKVILEEIRRKEDTPQGKVALAFQETLFAGSPYGLPVLGLEESVLATTRRTFLDYREAFYSPDNLVIVVVGDIDADGITERVRDTFGDLEPIPEAAPRDFELVAPPKPRIEVIEKDVQQSYLLQGYLVPAFEHPDLIVLDVMATILGSGRSSRLYRRLVEETALCTSVSAGIWAMRVHGAFSLGAVYDPQNDSKVREALMEEVARLRDVPLAKDELDKAVTMLTTSFAFQTETNSDLAETLGYYECISNIEGALSYLDRVRAVTAEDIQRVAREFLKDDSYVLAIVRPPEGGSKSKTE